MIITAMLRLRRVDRDDLGGSAVESVMYLLDGHGSRCMTPR